MKLINTINILYSENIIVKSVNMPFQNTVDNTKNLMLEITRNFIIIVKNRKQ